MENEKDIAISIKGLKKRYRLGVIGGGTLQGDIQSWWARVRGKDDPNLKIGKKIYGKNESFMALDGIDLTVYKGERLGIIGHNGAGKSTLLKLLSRVTAPTDGEICIDGRISSMLEVGTGFNGELTGRENIYLNGAILGMTTAEVDSKIEQIIEFSECRQFIDTPVKRYSSGMYVKLAFAVAAHLDSEILIMDEVLAVGDMAFQKKCLDKMSQVSKDEGRTILYVSHNMNTIRQLCDRCIVLDHGKIVFNGDVEEAIEKYMSKGKPIDVFSQFIDLRKFERPNNCLCKAKICSIEFDKMDNDIIKRGTPIRFKLKWEAIEDLKSIRFRMIIRTLEDFSVGMAVSDIISDAKKGQKMETHFSFSTELLANGRYSISIALFQNDDLGHSFILDHINKAFSIEILEDTTKIDFLNSWKRKWWGSIHFPIIDIIE